MKINTWLPQLGMILFLHFSYNSVSQNTCLRLIDSGFVNNPGFEDKGSNCPGCHFLSCSSWEGSGSLHDLSCCRVSDNCFATIPEGQVAASGDFHENATFGLKEYIGNCLVKPVSSGYKYRATMYILISPKARHDPTIDSVSFSIFGSTQCDSFNIPAPNAGISLADCPTISNHTWETLTTFKIPAIMDQWMEVEAWFDLNSANDLQAIYFGPACRDIIGVDFTLREMDIQYGLDHFQIFQYTEEFIPISPPSVNYCEGEMQISQSPFDSTVWYINGSAQVFGQVPAISLGMLQPGDLVNLEIYDQGACYLSDTLEVLLTDTSQILQITTLSDANCQKNGVISIHVFPEDFAVDTLVSPPIKEFASIAPGTYIVTISDGQGCTFTRSAEVILTDAKIPIDLGPDLIMCPGEEIPIYDLTGNGPLNWSTGEISDTVYIKNSASLIARYVMENCVTSDTIDILKEELTFIPPQTYLCPGDSTEVLLDGKLNILWFDGDTSKTKTFKTIGAYQLSVIGEYCIWDYEVSILPDDNCVIPEKVNHLFPNIFSPNLDGVNDTFAAFGVFEDVSLQIFNRWGDLIHSTSQTVPEWDGKVKGQLSPDGVYMYAFKARSLSGELIREVGTVTLIR